MRPVEEFVGRDSEFFVNFPSAPIMETFVYPTHLGHSIYLPGYEMHRKSFDNFQLIYVNEGKLTVEYGSRRETADKGSFILLDCYEPHGYWSSVGWDALWIHFDGPPARNIYKLIVSRLGTVFKLSDPSPILRRMELIYDAFAAGEAIVEPLISKYLNDILVEFLIYDQRQIKVVQRAAAVDACKTYIQNHLDEELRVDELAEQSGMSTYYFIRVFKHETGMTPHEFIVNARIKLAKLLLLESNMPLGQVCRKTGFSSESVFCAAFKKSAGTTPAAFRKSGTTFNS